MGREREEEQPSLFGDAYGGHPPFQKKSETSRLAANQIRGLAPTIRSSIFAWLLLRGPRGATRDEIEERFNLSGSTVRPRCRELEKEKKLVRAGVQRPTRSGRMAEVYVAAEFGGKERT